MPLKSEYIAKTNRSFYLADPGPTGRDALLLVPSFQFKQFLSLANSQLGTKLSIPGGVGQAQFLLTFTGVPLPRFLGQTNNGDTLNHFKSLISSLPRYDVANMPAATLKVFKDMMDKAYGSFKPNKSLEIRDQKRVQRQKNLGRMTKRVQRYLGLRERAAYKSCSGMHITFINWHWIDL
jgi:hypothetical protein